MTQRVLAGMLAAAAAFAAPASAVEPAEVRAVVEQVLSAEADAGPWSADDGYCLDLAAKWFERLARAGLPARIVTVDPSRAAGTAVVDGRPVRAGKFHAFVAVGSGPGEVIVDAAWRQFFTEPGGLPEVFVGTRAGAARAFAERPGALRVELYDDPYRGRYDPHSFTALVYGFGPNAALRLEL